MKKYAYIIIALLVLGCQKETKKPPVKDSSKQEVISWIHLDLEKDSVPGISLELAYDELELEGKGEPVLVAVMDMPVAINHEDLKNQIHTNDSEIPDNGKDDDSNGFIDDHYGWNFLGYGKYNYEQYASFVRIRIIKQHEKKFKDKTITDIQPKDTSLFKQYQLAIKKHETLKSKEEKYWGYVNDAEKEHYDFLKAFGDRINGNIDYTEGFLDSLPTYNEEEKELVRIMKRNLGWGYTFDFTFKDDAVTLIDQYITNNLNYNERKNIGDQPLDYESNDYGNANVDATTDLFHGTQVSGLIAATRNNSVGIRGISNNIDIMPVVVEPKYGHYNDKDLYNGIRYAVDNGARIINFSGNKDITENPALLFSALKYAENNGVLVIVAAGNDGLNIDSKDNQMYFSDSFEGNTVSNLVKVGATTKNRDSTLVAFFSNYGKENVDLFAPGHEIRTTDTGRLRYIETSGTSLSNAITAGVAALIWSNYPKLSHQQVKSILMDSGTPMDNLKVSAPDGETVLFADLSKSGKILNAFAAMKMAKSMAEKGK